MGRSEDRLDILRREGKELAAEAKVLRSKCEAARTQLAVSCAELRHLVNEAKARNREMFERRKGLQ